MSDAQAYPGGMGSRNGPGYCPGTSQNSSPSQPPRFPDGLQQHVDFIDGIVNIKTRTARAIDPKDMHKRHGTMVSSTNGHPALVQNRSHIVRMQVLDVKRDHATARFGLWPVELDIRRLAQLLQGITDQEMFVGLHCLHAQALQILDRGCQTDARRNRGRTSLK